jgi:hypothetical protein
MLRMKELYFVAPVGLFTVLLAHVSECAGLQRIRGSPYLEIRRVPASNGHF